MTARDIATSYIVALISFAMILAVIVGAPV